MSPPVFIVFGALGALSRGKLLPALGRLVRQGRALRILGVDLDPATTPAVFRRMVLESLGAVDDPEEQARLAALSVDYQPLSPGTEGYAVVRRRLEASDAASGGVADRIIYLAIPPGAAPEAIEALGAVGLNRPPEGARPEGGSLPPHGEPSRGGAVRLVIEKPFGWDLESARALNTVVHRHFDERQVYRIDHYLGKETVQNLLVFRLHNALIESIWNNERVEAVQITVAESVGVEGRGAYYDKVGALRDVVQNHLTQLLTLVAMEPPEAFQADSIRRRKLEALRAIAPPDPADVVVGQYTAGILEDGDWVPGYLDCDGVDPMSDTETFVAMKVEVDTPRWRGVPFYLRSGKRLPKRLSQIALRFRPPSVSVFDMMGMPSHSQATGANTLLITIQPDEGFSLHFELKIPGTPFRTRSADMSFKYRNAFGALPNAYETLLVDVINGDQTLFVDAPEVEESWRIFDPIIHQPRVLVPYAAGTWGPPDADRLALPDERLWQAEYTEFDVPRD